MKWRLPVALAGALLLACAAAAAGAWLLADTEAVRRAIEGKISDLARAEVRYETLSVRVFPLPHAELRGVTVRIADTLAGSLPVVEIRLALLPLLGGKVRPTALRIDQPVLKLSTRPGAPGDPLLSYRQAVGPLVDALVRETPGLSVSLSGGRLDVLSAGRMLASLQALSASVSVSAQGVDVSAASSADLWAMAQARARIESGSLAASASVQLTGLQLDGLLNGNPADDVLRVRPAPVDADIDIETDGRSRLRLGASGSAPQVAFASGARKHELGALRAAGEVVLDSGGATGTLKDLQLGRVISGARAVLRLPPAGAAVAFEFNAAALDLAQLHAAAAALAGDNAAALAATRIVPAGILRELSLVGAWPTGSSTVDVAAIRGASKIEAATVAVPAAGIVVRNGSGRFVLADGELRGSELAGEIGRSSFSGGSLALELLAQAPLRSLSGALRADLADALRIARHLLGARAPEAIAGIESLSGRATGALDYDARRRAEPLKLEFAGIKAQGRYRGVAFPLVLSGGGLQYSAAALRLRGLSGSGGRSSVRDASVEISFASVAVVKAASGEAVLQFEEIFPWLQKIDALRPVLADLDSATGSARLRLANLSGPLAQPAAVQFEAAFEPSQLTIRSPSLPAPLTLANGAGEISARRLKLTGVAIAAGDARATVSGVIDDYAAEGRRANLALSQGLIGQVGLDWIRARWQLPADAMPRAPVAVAEAQLRWPDAGPDQRTAQGKLRIGDAVDADFDVSWRPGDLQLQRLALKDADTDARATLHQTPGRAELSFDGSFDRRTLARMLARPPAGEGVVRGQFRAAIDLREPYRSIATGSLQGKGRLEIAGQGMELSGRVEGRQNALVIDGQLAAKTLDVEKLLAAVQAKAEPGAAARASLWELPVSGRIALAADSIALGRHVLRQVAGSAEISPKRIAIVATEAEFCGVAAPFSAVIAPAALDGSVQLRARGIAMEDVLLCVLGEAQEFTGTLDLDADLTASGPADAIAIANAARGSFKVLIRDGWIRKAGVIGRTVSADQVVARLPADARKLAEQEFPFRELSLIGSIDSGKARLDPGVLDSPGLGLSVRGDVALNDGALDLEGLIAPIRRMGQSESPVVGTLGGPLVAVPVRIRGTLNDPKVEVLAAQAVATALLKIMTGRFLLPFQLLQISGADSPRD